MSMKSHRYKIGILVIFLVTVSYLCVAFQSTKNNTIHLRWYKSYTSDSFEKNITGLHWCLSYLGADIPMDSTARGFNQLDSTVILNVKNIGMNSKAKRALSRFHKKLKKN